jgi:succinate-semialdehyde dehydrogenase/glutarate-semialdehyde dehydrogenase
VIHGNAARIAEQLIANPQIRKVSFTGSTEVGRVLGQICGRHIKRFTAELGGHAPVILHEDTDTDSAATLLAAAKFFNAGQSCMAPTRFFVHRGIVGDFADALTAKVAAIQVGNGRAPGTTMGALINQRAVENMSGFVKDAVACGAELRFGGTCLDDPGSFFAPSVLMNVPMQARIMTEEPYGPLAPITAYDDVNEAVAAANGLPYGLCAYVFGRDTERAGRTAGAIEAGLVGINTLNVGGPMVPFGGVKESGLGREGGRHGLLEHFTTKTYSTVEATAQEKSQ